MMVLESHELAVLISERQFTRYLQRLDVCRRSPWSDIWLACGGIGGGLTAAAVVTVIALPQTVPWSDKVILWMLALLGGIALMLCMITYFTQRAKEAERLTS